ncbi:MAG: trimethylamine methyltransferase family protein [Rhizobiaceae bacterium]|nr:trimethylamine methyltransferase family protein [Rhizobiaceae bacterium]
MSQDRRGGGRKSKVARGGGGIAQLPWEHVRNPYPPMQMLDEERMETLHRTSMRILSELGMRVMSDRVLDLFESAGAIVDRQEKTIRIDESLVAEALRTVPSSFNLNSRNPAKQLHFGDNSLVFGLVAGPPNVHDRINGRRAGNLPDYQNFVRLAHHFNAIHMLGNQVVAPIELPAESRHLDTYNANISLSDLCFHCSAIGRDRAMDAINMAAIARGISVDEMRAAPGVTTIISVNSPRLFDDAMAEGLMAMAEFGQPVTVTPFTLMGAMTPVTLAAALCQQNAEALFGVVLTQLVNPGTPVMYGAFTSNVDMKSGAPAFGTPENAKANIIAGQLARRYSLPYRTSNANASNVVDLQAAYETEMATWGAVLGGANLIYHAAGWLEGGLTASYEKLVLDVEILQNMMEFLRPLPFQEDDLGFEAIKSVPAGGHFFGSEHTMSRYTTAFYQPMLSNWQNYGAWQEAGGKDALERCTELWQQALRDYEEPAMDPAIREELDAYMARRRKELIGSGI